MAEYIDRDALKDRMAGFVPPFIDESNRAYLDGLTDAYTLICQAPAADVVERNPLPADVEEIVKRLWLAKAVLRRNKDLIALLSDAADAIEFLHTYKVTFENIISMGGWWLVGRDKNLYRMDVPMNWPPKGTKVIDLFPLPEPPKEKI